MRFIIYLAALFPLIGFSQINYEDALRKSNNFLIIKFNENNFKNYLELYKDSTLYGVYKKTTKTGWIITKYYKKKKIKKADEFVFKYKLINDIDSNIYVTIFISKDTIQCYGCIDIKKYNGNCNLNVTKEEAIQIAVNSLNDSTFKFLCAKFDWFIFDDLKNCIRNYKGECVWFPFRENIFTYKPNNIGGYLWVILFHSEVENIDKCIFVDSIDEKIINN